MLVNWRLRVGIVPLQSYNHSKDLKFLMHNGQPPVIKIIITAFKHIKHNTDRTLCHFVLSNLLEYCKSRGALPGPLFCQPNLVPITVYQFIVALIPVDTKATAFGLALLRLRLIMVSQMRKSALLAAGYLMLSKYISALNASKSIKF